MNNKVIERTGNILFIAGMAIAFYLFYQIHLYVGLFFTAVLLIGMAHSADNKLKNEEVK